ncbi:oxidoreductase [Mycena amicta]|nr:oxidoreductase [Mycena amicta]
MKVLAFDPAKDISSLEGKVILEAVLEYAKHNPARVYFTGRDAKRGAAIVEETKSVAQFVQCDMSFLDSVKAAALSITSETERLDVVVFNAGIMNVPPALTKEGYETHFGVNHMAHALFFKLFLSLLLHTASLPDSDVRIASLSSLGYAMHPGGGILFDKVRTTLGSGLVKQQRYGQSKLANIFLATEIARRYPQFTAVSIHPGVVKTELLENLGWLTRTLSSISVGGNLLTPAQGAYNMLWATTAAKSTIENGAFYVPVGEKGPMRREVGNEKLAAKLWDWTEKELEAY